MLKEIIRRFEKGYPNNEEGILQWRKDMDWLIKKVVAYRKKEFEEIVDDWYALADGEYEDKGFIVTHHDLSHTSEWWDYYDVEFKYSGKRYAYQYRKHKSPNVCEIELTKPIETVS